MAFSKDLLGLEKAYVTRNGDECGMPTHKLEINYFFRETQGTMDNPINAISEFHTKLFKWVGHCYDNIELIWVVFYAKEINWIDACYALSYQFHSDNMGQGHKSMG